MEGRLAGQKREAIPPTPGMVDEARKGLALQQQFGRGESKRRMEIAQDIAMKQPLNPDQWRTIAGYQARYYGDGEPFPRKDVTYEDGGPDARYIASKLLGGRPGQEQAFEVVPDFLR